MKNFIFPILIGLLFTTTGFFTGCSSKNELSPVSSPTNRVGEQFRPETASEVKDGSLTLDQAISLAIEYNPGLIAQRKSIHMAEARIIQAKLWPNPTLALDAEDIPFKNFGFYRSKNVVSIEQEISLSGKLSARGKVAQKEQEIALLEYEIALRNLISDVKKAFNGVLAAQQRVEIAQRSKEIAQELFGAAKKRVDAKAAPKTELIKARLELTRAAAKLLNAKSLLPLAGKRLNALIGLGTIKPEKYDGALKDSYPLPSEDELRELIYATHPELSIRQKEKELAQSQLELAKSERYPDITVRAGYGRNEFENENTAELGIVIPLPIFNRNQGEISEAQLRIQKAKEDYQAAENSVFFQLTNALADLTQTMEQAKQYREMILSDAQTALELVKNGYEHGKFSYLELLDAQRTLAETQDVYLEIIERLNSAAANLEGLTGKPLEQKK